MKKYLRFTLFDFEIDLYSNSIFFDILDINSRSLFSIYYGWPKEYKQFVLKIFFLTVINKEW